MRILNMSNEELRDSILKKRNRLNQAWENEQTETDYLLKLCNTIMIEQNILIKRLIREKERGEN